MKSQLLFLFTDSYIDSFQILSHLNLHLFDLHVDFDFDLDLNFNFNADLVHRFSIVKKVCLTINYRSCD